jgi:16S rRNA (cytidine1402-2'-O)-methyltransferase
MTGTTPDRPASNGRQLPEAAGCGRLVLVPNALDQGGADIDASIAAGVLRRAAALTHWVVEDAKSARAFLKRVNMLVPLAQLLQALDIRELPRPRKGTPSCTAPSDDIAALLAPAQQGHDVGLLSDAGLPAVADPGAQLVAAAHAAGIPVQALPGASSITLALAASGLNGQRFAFEGYLPQDEPARSKRIRELEARSRSEGQTQIAIETPYRNTALAAALVATLDARTQLSLAWGLTLPGGGCRTATVARWRAAGDVELSNNLPAIFLWLASR